LLFPYKLRAYIKFLLIPIFLFNIFICQAQQSLDYKVHANIVYHFTKYLEWPKEVGGSKNFNIGIIGDTRLYAELKTLTVNKSVGSQKIFVKNISGDGPFTNYHMLFLSQGESVNLKKIELMVRNQPVILITENTGLAKKGSSINFVTVGDRLKLEINKRNILSKDIKIASELLQLATIVD
jgi:hypothetical protein